MGCDVVNREHIGTHTRRILTDIPQYKIDESLAMIAKAPSRSAYVSLILCFSCLE